MAKLVTRTKILEETARGLILEIAFVGKHSSGLGHYMAQCSKEVVAAMAPAAVVFNMLDFTLKSLQDLLGPPKLEEIFEICYFVHVADAVAYLRKILWEATA